MKEESICDHCGSSGAYVYCEGKVMNAGYGSVLDTTWFALAAEREGKVYCDDCVKAWVKNGEAYPYWAYLGEIENKPMPVAAYSAIFEYHALKAVRMLQDNGVVPVTSDGPVDIDQIKKLRGSIEYDPSTTTSFKTGQANFGAETMKVAKAHVLASRLLGARLEEEDIILAANDYAETVVGTLKIFDELFASLEV